MKTIRRTEEFARWFVSLRDERARHRIRARARRLSLGNPGDARSVGSGVFEMRIDYGPGYRVYYTEAGDDVVVVLLGGTKKTQKRDIARAVRRVKEL